ncbi:MAG TPA: hypothetical protein VF795_12410 [Desulfuromonadaceae bacterium]
MNTSVHDLSQCSSSAMEALKRAYAECPNSMAGSFIIIAFNALIRLERELEKAREKRADGRAPLRGDCSATA